ncbi:hypothetical protein PG994_003128 [Apiospora phragmitis]|uniref:MAPEG family protein n=1 Tax=Apiospora phragmitis TaxID=2905665 RepID=A0ABR1W753_9PEZI
MEGVIPKFLIEYNFSYYTVGIHAPKVLRPWANFICQIPVAMLVALIPRFVTICFCGRFFNGYYPRGLPDDIQMLPVNELSPKVRGRLFRADAAMQNSIENLPLFAAAVVAGNASYFLSAAELNLCCLTYLLLRALYMAFYVFWQDNPAFPALTRTLLWLMGVAVEMYLFELAARQPPLMVVHADTEPALLTQPGTRFYMTGSIGKNEL